MTEFPEFSFDNPKLFAFYLGGKVEGCNIEMHDVVFTVGQSRAEILEKVKKKWIGTPSFHIDSYVIIENIEGYDISLSKNKSDAENRLYFVNMGSYRKNHFGENHFMGFYVAKSRAESIEKAKVKVPQTEELIHGDNIHNLDDCINLDEVDNFYINLNYTGENKELISVNGYMKIK